jgi:hypothetical protein
MIPKSCLLIDSKKFPVLPGEEQEITNERMYGKALCQYLHDALPLAGIDVPMYCNEDWGWFLEVQRGSFKMGLCIYSDPDAAGDPERYALVPSIHQAKKWSWSKFKKVDVSREVLELINVVERVLESDADVTVVRRLDDYAFD